MLATGFHVSMKSGLGDRNKVQQLITWNIITKVSMKSALRDRNNVCSRWRLVFRVLVSMKSGLRDRNNAGIMHQM